jgi:hypothetical protein
MSVVDDLGIFRVYLSEEVLGQVCVFEEELL